MIQNVDMVVPSFWGHPFCNEKVALWKPIRWLASLDKDSLVVFYYIIYSYKYLESHLIKHCHVIFIHSLGQPLIVRSHSKVHRSRGNPKEIPTWASRVSNYRYFPWFNRHEKHGVQRQVRRCRRRRNFIYYIEYFRKAADILLLLVSDANIFDIIYQLSPLLECDPMVCLPSKS